MTDLLTQMYVAETWRGTADGMTENVFDPGTGEVIAQVPSATLADVEEAVASARAGFASGVWSNLTPAERGRVLARAADLLEARASQFAKVESLNQGQPLANALSGAVPGTVQVLRYYAAAAAFQEGRALDLRLPNGRIGHARTRREAAGVAALLVPNNGPLLLATWKIAPALAAGCSIIVKPADETPLSALLLIELLIEAGVPGSVVNVLTGPGYVIGNALAAHDDVDVVSFTGSTATGRKVAEAALGNLKKVGLELGGKSPVIIFDDADLDIAIPGAARAIFSNSGQICTSGSRLYVQSDVYQQVIDGIAEFGRTLRMGYRTDDNVETGPMISEKHQQRVLGMIADAQAAGAELALGGSALDRPGFFVEPTIVVGADHGSEIAQEEVFGPVLAAWSFDDEAEAVARANGTKFGLAGSVWSQDIMRCNRVANAIRGGRIGVNVHAAPYVELPTGGYGQSGWGRELGPNGLDLYLQDKAIIVQG